MDYGKRTAVVDALIADARNKQCPPGFTITSYAASAMEMLPAMGFRWLLIDLEHTELQMAKGELHAVLRSAEATGLPYFDILRREATGHRDDEAIAGDEPDSEPGELH